MNWRWREEAQKGKKERNMGDICPVDEQLKTVQLLPVNLLVVDATVDRQVVLQGTILCSDIVKFTSLNKRKNIKIATRPT